mmetsp:Transcript_13257/g.49567  ORF Transcript_13257/g.49567 Transcript_13257/m.49567 type:complete len:279 (+) Transcript_13257:1654-2490(+)
MLRISAERDGGSFEFCGFVCLPARDETEDDALSNRVTGFFVSASSNARCWRGRREDSLPAPSPSWSPRAFAVGASTNRTESSVPKRNASSSSAVSAIQSPIEAWWLFPLPPPAPASIAATRRRRRARTDRHDSSVPSKRNHAVVCACGSTQSPTERGNAGRLPGRPTRALRLDSAASAISALPDIPLSPLDARNHMDAASLLRFKPVRESGRNSGPSPTVPSESKDPPKPSSKPSNPSSSPNPPASSRWVKFSSTAHFSSATLAEHAFRKYPYCAERL